MHLHPKARYRKATICVGKQVKGSMTHVVHSKTVTKIKIFDVHCSHLDKNLTIFNQVHFVNRSPRFPPFLEFPIQVKPETQSVSRFPAPDLKMYRFTLLLLCFFALTSRFTAALNFKISPKETLCFHEITHKGTRRTHSR